MCGFDLDKQIIKDIFLANCGKLHMIWILGEIKIYQIGKMRIID